MSLLENPGGIKLSWTSRRGYGTITKVPILVALELVTVPNADKTMYQTRVYRFGTSIFECERKNETASITTTVEWVAENHTIPDEVVLYNKTFDALEER